MSTAYRVAPNGFCGNRNERVTAWLQTLPKPVGIMACNDFRGRQVLEASMVAEIPVPDEVAVVGVDDDQLLCELSNPPLSSVRLNAEQGGYQAAELLDQLIARPKRRPQQIDVEPLWVVCRQSTEVVAVDDPEVAAALRFIRDKVLTPIGVEDVVQQVALSRRMLELRFERALGRTIRAGNSAGAIGLGQTTAFGDQPAGDEDRRLDRLQ